MCCTCCAARFHLHPSHFRSSEPHPRPLTTLPHPQTKALATVTAIIDGLGSIGAALGPALTGYIAQAAGFDGVFLMLYLSALAAGALLARPGLKEVRDWDDKVDCVAGQAGKDGRGCHITAAHGRGQWGPGGGCEHDLDGVGEAEQQLSDSGVQSTRFAYKPYSKARDPHLLPTMRSPPPRTAARLEDCWHRQQGCGSGD
jgi:hypothetical protein